MADETTRPELALAEEWRTEFVQAMEAMADLRPDMSLQPGGATATGDALWWQQSVDAAPGATIWVGARQEAWNLLGGRILAAAGIEESGEAESRNTYLEVLRQSLGGLAKYLTELMGREVALSGESGEHEPEEGVLILRIALAVDGQDLPPFELGLNSSMLQALQGSGTAPEAAPSEEPVHEPGQPFVNPGASNLSGRASATLDLLLDVEMPITVSFGRTRAPMQEILNLIAGSIIELDRTIAEPVEVIVNNCVVARGEVVVVDGNYGVRIIEVMSRQERLKQGRRYLLPSLTVAAD